MPGSAVQTYASLRSGARFGYVYREGARRRSGGLSVFQASSDTRMPEVGFVAGRGVGNAVVRNRAKRRLREATHKVLLAPHTSYVVVAGPSVASVPFDTLVVWLKRGMGTTVPASDRGTE